MFFMFRKEAKYVFHAQKRALIYLSCSEESLNLFFMLKRGNFYMLLKDEKKNFMQSGVFLYTLVKSLKIYFSCSGKRQTSPL